MSMPGPVESVALVRAGDLFEAWVKHLGGTPMLHSQTPDRKSFQAGFLAALIEMEPVVKPSAVLKAPEGLV